MGAAFMAEGTGAFTVDLVGEGLVAVDSMEAGAVGTAKMGIV